MPERLFADLEQDFARLEGDLSHLRGRFGQVLGARERGHLLSAVIDRCLIRSRGADTRIEWIVLRDGSSAIVCLNATDTWGAEGVDSGTYRWILKSDGTVDVPQPAPPQWTNSLWIPAPEFVVAGGAPTLACVGGTPGTNGRRATPAWAFDGGSGDEAVNATFFCQQNVVEGPYTAFVHWAPSDGAAGNVKWQMFIERIPEGNQIDANGPDYEVVDATNSNQDEHLVTDGALSTTAGFDNMVPGSYMRAHLAREASDTVVDTYGADAWFIGLEIQHTVTVGAA